MKNISLIAFLLIFKSTFSLACNDHSLCAYGPLGYCHEYHHFLSINKSDLDTDGEEAAKRILKAYGKEYDPQSPLNLVEQAQLLLDKGAIVHIYNNKQDEKTGKGGGGVFYDPFAGKLVYEFKTGMVFDPVSLEITKKWNEDGTYDPHSGKVVWKEGYGLQYDPHLDTIVEMKNHGITYDPNVLLLPKRFNLSHQKRVLRQNYQIEKQAAYRRDLGPKPFILNFPARKKYTVDKVAVKTTIKENYMNRIKQLKLDILEIKRRHQDTATFTPEQEKAFREYQQRLKELKDQKAWDIEEEKILLGKEPSILHPKKRTKFHQSEAEIHQKKNNGFLKNKKVLRDNYSSVFPSPKK